MNPTHIRKLIVAGAATGAFVFGVGASASATTPPTAPPGSEAPAGSAAPSGGSSIVATAPCSICEMLTDANGMTLYAFTPDPAGQSTCTGDCATNWPPLFVDGDTLPADLDPSLFSLAPNADGGNVLAINGHPLYTFAGDAAPGDVNGQGLGDKWYAVTPEGELIGEAAGEAAATEGTAAAAEGTAAPGSAMAGTATTAGSGY